jgi:hypothetical protein
LSRHKKCIHLKTKEVKNTDYDGSNSFIDCGEDIKQEIKIEDTIEEDLLSIQIEAVENIVNTKEMAIDEECKTEVKREKDQDLLIVDYGEAINQQVKEELTDMEIKQEIEEEVIQDQDPLSILQNSGEEDINIDQHHKMEINDS